MYVEIEVEDSANGMRLDRYVSINNPAAPHSFIEKSLRKGKILLGGKKAKSSSRLRAGDILSVAESFLRYAQLFEEKKPAQKHDKFAPEIAGNLFTKYLNFDHEEFFAINKPAGLAVQGGSKVKYSVDGGLALLNRRAKNEHEKLRIVHRIDKETSGLLLIAKGRLAATKITGAFRDCKIKKRYFALLLGHIAQKSGTINKPLLDKQGVMREAITDFKVIKQFEKYALISFEPITGRTHQLRLHSAEIGCVILGDEKYSNPKQRGEFQALGARNLMLHSTKIILPSELFGKKIVLNSQIPGYFKRHI